MSEVSKWIELAKTSADATHFLPVTGQRKLSVLSLFPSLTSVGPGTGIAPYVSITNKNQINLRELRSANSMLTIAAGGNSEALFTVVASAIDLNVCSNLNALFLKTVNLTSNVGATILPVANGGTGLASWTAKSLVYSSATGTLASLGAMTTNGQLVIAGTSGPALANLLSADSSVTITNGNGSINLAVAFANITGSVSNSQITSMAATKLTGLVLDAQMDTLTGSKIIGTRVQPNTTLDKLTLLNSKFSQVGTTAVTTEEILATYTLPAGTITAAGEGLEIEAWGDTAANANVKDIGLSFGGTQIITNAVTTAPNGLEYHIRFTILNDGAGATVCKGTLQFQGLVSEFGSSKHIVNFAASQILKLTGHNGIAAANDILFEGWTVKHLR